MKLYFVEIASQIPEIVLFSIAFIGAYKFKGHFSLASLFIRFGAGIMIASIIIFPAIRQAIYVFYDDHNSYTVNDKILFCYYIAGMVNFVAMSLLLCSIFLFQKPNEQKKSQEEPRSIASRAMIVVLLLVLYGLIPIAAGHGVGTVGMLVFMGNATEWLPGQGWGGLGALAVLASIGMPTRRWFLVVLTYGNVCLFTSIISFAIPSDALGFSVAASIPFCIVAFIFTLKCRNAFREKIVNKP